MKKVLLIAAFGMFFSCSKSDDRDCDIRILETKSLETEYGCTNTKYQLYNIVQGNNYIIIRNQNEFDTSTDDLNCRPQIDFATYDLLIGKKQLTSGNESISYNYFEDCSGKKMIVTFTQNSTMEAPVIIYHALIPKLNPTEQITVETVVE